MKTTIQERLSIRTDSQLLDIFNFLGHKNGGIFLPGMDMQYVFNSVCDELESRNIETL